MSEAWRFVGACPCQVKRPRRPVNGSVREIAEKGDQRKCVGGNARNVLIVAPRPDGTE